MPETIFGASPVEAALLIAALIIIYQVVTKTAGQATDVLMELAMPVVVVVVILVVIGFIGLWLYRQGQWSVL